MRLIGSESEEQHGEVSTIVDVSPEGKPPAERRLMTRADAERLLAEHGDPEPVSPADRAAIRSMLDIDDPEPLSPAAVDHLLGWYTAADKVAEVQRRLALGEVQGMLKPIGLGLDISAIVDPMAEMREQVLRSFSDMRQQVAAFLGVSSTENFRQMLAFAAQDQMVQALAEQRAQLERAMGSTGLGLKVAEHYSSFSVTAGSGALLTSSPLATASSRARTYEETRRYGGAWAEPPAEQGRLEAVRVQPADWQAVLTMAIKDGHASPKEVAAWLHGIAQQHGPGQKPADWAEIEMVAALYRERGHRYENQEAFVAFLARKGIAISVPTLQRRLAEYERVTGERVRPGRGSRRRGSL